MFIKQKYRFKERKERGYLPVSYQYTVRSSGYTLSQLASQRMLCRTVFSEI